MATRERVNAGSRAATRQLAAEIEQNRAVRSLRPRGLPHCEASDTRPVQPHDGASMIASVGYEGRSAAELLDALVGAGIDTLVDVRQNAISRKPGLSKRALAAGCRERGIEYVHEPSLGNPRDHRDDFRAGVDASRRAYEEHLAEQGQDALDRVASIVRNRTVALLCFEADHSTCHRSIVADQLRRLHPTATVQSV